MADLNIQMNDKDGNNLMPITKSTNVKTGNGDSNVELMIVDLQTKNQDALDKATDAKTTADGLSAVIETASATANQAITDAGTALTKGTQAYDLASTVESTATEAKNTADSAKEDTVNLAVRVSSLEDTQIIYTVIE